jgi:cyclic pyranopterin phosphate synthase
MTKPTSEPPHLTHVNEQGAAHMVDVAGKAVTERVAVARSRVLLSPQAAQAIRANTLQKGDCLQVARLAAIQATKWTSHLIPLCHAIPIESVCVESFWIGESVLEWQVTVKSTGKTGVEMEAITAASIAAVTVYDMCKGIDPAISLCDICLLQKTGGSKGEFIRNEMDHARTTAP